MKKIATFSILFFALACQTSQKVAQKDLLQKTVQTADLLLVSVQELKSQIGKRTNKDTEDVSRVFLPTLAKIESKATEIKTEIVQLDLTKHLDLVKLHSFQQEASMAVRQTQAISTSLDQAFTITLASDICFETGKYHLNIKGADLIENFVNADVQRLISYYENEPDYKTSTKVVRVSVTGYADLQGSKQIDKRTQSNQLISQKRADAVKSHLDYAFAMIKKHYKMASEIESLGLGESLPPTVTDYETVDNPQRRVCRISGLVYPDFESIALAKK